MSASIKTMQDKNGNQVHPRTRVQAVYDSSNNTLDTILTNKQDKTDNTLTTTAKTIVGAINEHESDISQLNEDIANKQAQNIQRIITISVADWNSTTSCTKACIGVTASNTVIVDCSDSTVSATAQATDSLTFTATATPSADVTVKVVILP